MMSVSRWILLCCLPVFSTALAQTHPTKPMITEIDHIVAVANDDVITYTELEKRVRLIKQQLPPLQPTFWLLLMQLM